MNFLDVAKVIVSTMWLLLIPLFFAVALDEAGVLGETVLTMFISGIILMPVMLIAGAALERRAGQFGAGALTNERHRLRLVSRIYHRVIPLPHSEAVERVRQVREAARSWQRTVGFTCKDCGHWEIDCEDAAGTRFWVACFPEPMRRRTEYSGIGLFIETSGDLVIPKEEAADE